MDVDGVAERLEGVEGDADGEYEVQEQAVGAAAEEEVGEGLGEEVVVLEDAENQQVDDDVGPHENAAAAGIGGGHQDAAEVGACGGEGDEEEETPIPPTIEEIGCCEDKEVLPAQGAPEEPVDNEDNRQEESELQRIEQHTYGCKDTFFLPCWKVLVPLQYEISRTNKTLQP